MKGEKNDMPRLHNGKARTYVPVQIHKSLESHLLCHFGRKDAGSGDKE